jgi:hypothetical protein
MLRIDKATIRELAVKASCDPRTIEKVIRGEPVRGMARHRARRVLLEAGIPTAPIAPEAEGGRP